MQVGETTQDGKTISKIEKMIGMLSGKLNACG